jgi:hypothetical protein
VVLHLPEAEKIIEGSPHYLEQVKRFSTLLVVCIDIKKGEAVPVKGHGGPQGCEMLRLPHSLDCWLTDGGEVVSLMCRPPFTPGRCLVFISVGS